MRATRPQLGIRFLAGLAVAVLRLCVASGDPAGGGGLGDFKDLGAVVWCRAFSVPFTSATLERS